MNEHELQPIQLFIEYCHRRDISTYECELELMHKLGWLKPVFLIDADTPVLNPADRKRLWEERSQSVDYEPWSNFRTADGHFLKTPIYCTVQQYPLFKLKRMLTVSVNYEEYDAFISRDSKRTLSLIQPIANEMQDNMKIQLDEQPEWERMVQVLYECELMLDEYEQIHKSDPPKKQDIANISEWTDYKSRLYSSFLGLNLDLKQKLNLTAEELQNLADRLYALQKYIIGDFNTNALLSFANLQLWASTFGRLRIVLDIARDIEILNIATRIYFKRVLHTGTPTCVMCGKPVLKQHQGRPRKTCNEECAKALKLWRQNIRRRARNFSKREPMYYYGA